MSKTFGGYSYDQWENDPGEKDVNDFMTPEEIAEFNKKTAEIKAQVAALRKAQSKG